MQKIEKAVAAIIKSGCADTAIQTRGVTQALKAVCSLLGNIEPLDISKHLLNFIDTCNDFSSYGSSKVDIYCHLFTRMY